MEWQWDTGVMDWEVDNAVADWRAVTNQPPDRQSEPPQESQSPALRDSSNCSDTQSQGNHESPSFTTHGQSDEMSQDRLNDRANDMELDDVFAEIEDTIMDVDDPVVDIYDTTVDVTDSTVAVENTFMEGPRSFIDMLADPTSMEANTTVIGSQADDAGANSPAGATNLPQAPANQPYILPQGQSFLQTCTEMGCGERMVDGRHCEYHKQQEIPPSCKSFGCNSFSMVEGYCFGHWNQAHGPETESRQFDCEFPGCINKKESGSPFCTWHGDGENPEDSHLKRRICESLECCENKRKGLYCVSHWNELNPHDMLCDFSGCSRRRRGQTLYCSGHLRQQDPANPVSYKGKRKDCSIVECPARSWAGGLCSRHWRLANPDHNIGKVRKICETSGCKSLASRKALCYEHAILMWPGHILCEAPECTNRKWKGGLCEKHGRALDGSRRVRKACTAPGCEKSVYNIAHKDLCHQHAKEMWPESVACEAPGCTFNRKKGGLCRMHAKEAGIWTAS